MKYLPLLLAATFLFGCRDPGVEVDEAHADTTESAGQAPEAAPSQAPEPPHVKLEQPLAGGVIDLPFEYHTAVERDVTAKKTGIVSREVGIEFLEGSVPTIDATMEEEFRKVGYSRSQRDEHGNAIRSLYTKADAPDVLVWVRPGAPRGERFKLQVPRAKGTVYLAWQVSK